METNFIDYVKIYCRSGKGGRGSMHMHRAKYQPLGGPDGGDYQVRRLPGSAKEYTCPACLRPIPAGTAHVVAWPEEAPFGLPQGVEGRRHWHSECWRRGLRPL